MEEVKEKAKLQTPLLNILVNLGSIHVTKSWSMTTSCTMEEQVVHCRETRKFGGSP